MESARVDDRGVIVVCSSCGNRNRIPYKHLKDTGRCPGCRAPMPPPGIPIEVHDERHFNQLIKASPVPVVVDFWAPWCAPCRTMAPAIQEVASRAAGRHLFVKVNTDALPELSGRYQVRSIPTLAVFSGGQEVKRTVGAQSVPAIEALINQARAA